MCANQNHALALRDSAGNLLPIENKAYVVKLNEISDIADDQNIVIVMVWATIWDGYS